MQLIECVPNFSEGVNQQTIDAVAGEIRSVAGVKLLNVDSGKAVNRTVMTFAGQPDKVTDAAFLAVKKAGELIDMRAQKGEHPRMGATDVCPLIPISGISMQEVTVYANKLARRVGQELNIPVYLYEHSQADKNRSKLSVIRAGEYEGFFTKMGQPGWQPDYGPMIFDIKRGATVIGARDLLIAYNINLDTRSVDIAGTVAAQIRESGRKVKSADGNFINKPGTLKGVKAIGWYIQEYGQAQVSMNLTDINATPIHIVFDEVCSRANALGVKVTGSELIGMIPLKAMLDAGRYFLEKRGLATTVDHAELIQAAVTAMGLDELAPFNAEERVIEYLI